MQSTARGGGELILPARDETSTRTSGGLRVVLFASFKFGYMALQAIKAYVRQYPDRVQLVGLVTDDPVNQTARIGLKKRVWKFLDRDETVAIETAVVESALSEGVPAYTGEIKIDGFMAPGCDHQLRLRSGDRCLDHQSAGLRHL